MAREAQIPKIKVKKFGVLTILCEVEYVNPVLGRLLAFFMWFRTLRIQKCILTMNNAPKYTFYRLIVLKFLKGKIDEEQ